MVIKYTEHTVLEIDSYFTKSNLKLYLILLIYDAGETQLKNVCCVIFFSYFIEYSFFYYIQLEKVERSTFQHMMTKNERKYKRKEKSIAEFLAPILFRSEVNNFSEPIIK